MRDRRHSGAAALVAMAVFTAVVLHPATPAAADGTESLGEPSTPLAAATAMATGATGLVTGPGTMTVVVPADATVTQVLLYWEGQYVEDRPPGTITTDQIVVDAHRVTGALIGGPTRFFTKDGQGIFSSTYRADITALGLVGTGTSDLRVTPGDFSFRNNGAGVVVLYEQPEAHGAVALRDGNDLAYVEFEPSLDTTVPQTITFAADQQDRRAEIRLFATSVDDARPRPNTVMISYSNGAAERLVNPFSSNAGLEFDQVVSELTIPVGVSSLTIEARSESDGSPNRPASFAWLMAGVSISDAPASEIGGSAVGTASPDGPVGSRIGASPVAQPTPAVPSFTG